MPVLCAEVLRPPCQLTVPAAVNAGHPHQTIHGTVCPVAPRIEQYSAGSNSHTTPLLLLPLPL
jgi:hypothetical protein